MAEAITPGTTVVSVMAGNNEIGVMQPLADIARLAHAAGAWFHTDASQAAGLVDIDMAAMGIDLLSCTAHKIYGPKGVGALVVRRASKVALAPRQRGGGHERGLRSGTLNVPGIVGFGEAARLARARRADRRGSAGGTAGPALGTTARRRCQASTCAAPNSRGCRTTSTSGSTA